MASYVVVRGEKESVKDSSAGALMRKCRIVCVISRLFPRSGGSGRGLMLCYEFSVSFRALRLRAAMGSDGKSAVLQGFTSQRSELTS